MPGTPGAIWDGMTTKQLEGQMKRKQAAVAAKYAAAIAVRAALDEAIKAYRAAGEDVDDLESEIIDLAQMEE